MQIASRAVSAIQSTNFYETVKVKLPPVHPGQARWAAKVRIFLVEAPRAEERRDFFLSLTPARRSHSSYQSIAASPQESSRQLDLVQVREFQSSARTSPVSAKDAVVMQLQSHSHG